MKGSQVIRGSDAISPPNSTLPNSPTPSTDWERKKMFTRKPAQYVVIASDKNPKNETSFTSHLSMGPGLLKYSRIEGELSPTSPVSQGGVRNSLEKLRETIGHSGSEKITIVKGMSYLGGGSRVKTETKEMNHSQSAQGGFLPTQSKIVRSRNYNSQLPAQTHSRTKSSLSFLLTPAEGQQMIKERSKDQKTVLSRESSVSGLCLSCANYRDMTQIINEKNAKLQAQLKEKDRQIAQINAQISSLRRDKNSLSLKVTELTTSLRQKEQSFLSQKSELMVRVEAYQKDIHKLKEKVKYESIQNSMLLRFRDQFQVLSQQFERLRHENAHLKRLIIQRGGTTMKQSGVVRHQSQTMQAPLMRKGGVYEAEDDCISLNLSEMSTTQDNF